MLTGGGIAVQRLYLLVRLRCDGGRILSAALADDDATKSLFRPWEVDLQGYCVLSNYQFTRAPLVVDCKVAPTGEVRASDCASCPVCRPVVPRPHVCLAGLAGCLEQVLRVIVLHSKSKAVGNGKRMWQSSGDERDEFILRSVLNRRRISAEAARLRQYIDTVLDASPGGCSVCALGVAPAAHPTAVAAQTFQCW